MAIKLNIVTQFDSRGIKAAQRELASVGRNIGRALDVAVIGGIAAATTGLVSAIKSASNFAAEYEGVSQVFGKAAESVQAFAKEASRTAGLSQTEALQASKVFGLFATKAGLSAESAADFSTTLVQLAGDLGSFNDVPTEEALAAIQSGLQGQAEPLRKFGVFLDDASLRAEALAMKIYDGSGALSAQQKMLASYSLILKQTNVQQGDYLKYADTFGNATKTITKDLENLKVELGQAVLPALESLLPAVRDLIPVLGAQLKAAIDSVDWKAFFKTLVDGITFLITYGPQLVPFIGTIYALVKAFGALKLILDVVTVSMGILNGTIALNPFGLALIAVGGLIGGLVLLKAELDKVNFASDEISGSFKDIQNSKDPFISVTKSALGYGIALDGIISKQAKAGVSKPSTGKNSSQIIASNYGVGAGGAVIGKADKMVIPDTTKSVADLVKGLGNLSASQSKAKKAADDAAQKLKAQKEALKSFKTELTGLSSGFASLTQATTNLGQFEQSVVDTFDNINKKIAEGLSNKTIGTKGLSALRSFLASEQAILLKNAKDRDAIIKKRGLAQALIDDVKSTFMGAGSLASLVDSQTKQVTTSLTRIVDGFSVTTKRTVDEVVGAKGVIGRLKEVVTKTKAFATQLTSLKQLGLNPDLFKQIVDAGPEVGGELATEILAGGSDSVKALNDTFKELQDVTASVAEQTAVVMYNAGVEVAGGLVEGLLAEEQRLVDAAKTLADAFNKAYQENIMALSIPEAPSVTPKVTAKTTVIAPKVTIKATPQTKNDAQKAVATINKYYAANPTAIKPSANPNFYAHA
jgi:hypothetical protein